MHQVMVAVVCIRQAVPGLDAHEAGFARLGPQQDAGEALYAHLQPGAVGPFQPQGPGAQAAQTDGIVVEQMGVQFHRALAGEPGAPPGGQPIGREDLLRLLRPLEADAGCPRLWEGEGEMEAQLNGHGGTAGIGYRACGGQPPCL